jgi:hypothetical protein
VKSPTRIEVFGGQSVVSVPVRLHPAYIPHAVLIAVIAFAWIADAAVAAVGWVSGG